MCGVAWRVGGAGVAPALEYAQRGVAWGLVWKKKERTLDVESQSKIHRELAIRDMSWNKTPLPAASVVCAHLISPASCCVGLLPPPSLRHSCWDPAQTCGAVVGCLPGCTAAQEGLLGAHHRRRKRWPDHCLVSWVAAA